MATYRLIDLDDGRQWLTDGADFGIDPDAAPDLLKALVRLLAAYRRVDSSDGGPDRNCVASEHCECSPEYQAATGGPCEYCQARAAIAKATA